MGSNHQTVCESRYPFSLSFSTDQINYSVTHMGIIMVLNRSFKQRSIEIKEIKDFILICSCITGLEK